MGIRTRKLILCIDALRVGVGSAPQRKVRILDDVTMLPLAETSWTAYSEKAAVIDAIDRMYANGGTSRNPHSLPANANEILGALANMPDEVVATVRERLNSWEQA